MPYKECCRCVQVTGWTIRCGPGVRGGIPQEVSDGACDDELCTTPPGLSGAPRARDRPGRGGGLRGRQRGTTRRSPLRQTRGLLSFREACLAGGGEMGALIRALDWSQTPIGPVASWSPSLRMMVRFLLANRFPLLLWWGPQYVSIYNDAYRPVLGTKHPWALGQPVSECWSEIWHDPAAADRYALPRRTGDLDRGHRPGDQPARLRRGDPFHDRVQPGAGRDRAERHRRRAGHGARDHGEGRRRAARGALRDLGARVGEAKTAEEACADRRRDPGRARQGHALRAALPARGRRPRARLAVLLACAGAPASPLDGRPRAGRTRAAAGRWPKPCGRNAAGRGRPGRRGVPIPPGPWSDPPHGASSCPSRSNTAHEPAGCWWRASARACASTSTTRSFLELVATPDRDGHRQRARLRGGAPARRGAGRARPRQDRLLLQRQPRVPHAADAHARARWRSCWRRRGGAARRAREQLEVVHRNGCACSSWSTRCSTSRASRPAASRRPTSRPTWPRSPPSWPASSAPRRSSAPACARRRLPAAAPSRSTSTARCGRRSSSTCSRTPSSSPSRARSRSRCVPARRSVELTVRDTGTGIPAEELPRLFERFHRVDGRARRARTRARASAWRWCRSWCGCTAGRSPSRARSARARPSP